MRTQPRTTRPSINRRTRAIAVVLLLAYLPACSSWRVENVSPQALIEAEHPAQVRVLRTNGAKQILHQPAITGDTLRGSVREPPIPLANVHAIETRHRDAGKTVLLVVGIVVLSGITAAAIVCSASDCFNFGLGS